MDTSAQLVAFVNAFVVNARRERWLELVQAFGQRTGKNGIARSGKGRTKLAGALDERYCTRFREHADVVKDLDLDLDLDQKCVVFDFHDAEVMKLGEALHRFHGTEAIISVVAGELALHTLDWGEIYLCKKPKK
jgi:hypothetical protein